MFSNCTDDVKNFANEVYFTSNSNVDEVLFRVDLDNTEKKIVSGMARPEDYNVTLRYSVDQSKVTSYNQGYYANASLLPSKYYQLEDKEDVIQVGAVKSLGVKLSFTGISELNMDSVYVLPIVISNSSVKSLNGQNVHYYVLKGSALINVVPSMDKNYFWSENSLTKPDVMNNLEQLTMEGLIYPKRFDDDGKSFISSFMGIEGQFLLRFGDAGFPMNQLQVATNKGNFPNADASKGVPVGDWFHVAVTFDGKNNGAVQIYINGKLQSEGNISGLTSVNLGTGGKDGFQIGRSYDNNRYLDGMMSELRIWNIVRTQSEIASNFYSVQPDSQGLVAYWKCNEGSGNTVNDHTSNGNNLLSPVESGVNWVGVSLPQKK